MSSASTEQVVIESGTRRITVPPERLYFAFASGRFEYDCTACGAQCCRGHGYELQAGAELNAHIATAVNVRFFLDRSDRDGHSHYHAWNTAPACFFLTETGRCQIQVEHGHAVKPQTCRLFPFNHLSFVDEFLIVRPHPALCPLRVTAVRTTSSQSDHGELRRAMALRPINLDVAPISGRSNPTAVELERSIVELSERHLHDDSYEHFAAEQLAATVESRDPSADRVLMLASCKGEVRQFRRSLHDVLGTRDPEPDGQLGSLIPTLVAITPALRADVLFRPPAPTAKATLDVDNLPYALLALEVLARLAVAAGVRDVTYQTLSRMFQEHRTLLSLLARLNSTVVWDSARIVDLNFGTDHASSVRFMSLTKALLPGAQQRTPVPLAELLVRYLPADDIERITFLRQLARRLAGTITTLEKHREPALLDHLRAPRRSFQRWFIARSAPEALCHLLEQQRRVLRPRGKRMP